MTSDTDVKKITKGGYDQIADQYLEWTEITSKARLDHVERLLTKLSPSPSSKFLELGCGAGIPVTQRLLETGAEVIANDISSAQIALAKARVPGAEFVEGDMMEIKLEPDSLDGVFAYFSLFHLPIAEQKTMLGRIFSWLQPGGWLAVNYGAAADGGKTGKFLGEEMYWANLGTDGSLEMIEGAGLEVVEKEVIRASLDEKDPDFMTEFLWVLARKGQV